MDELRRGETRSFNSAEGVWRAVALLIEELDCSDRCVEYSLDGVVRSYDDVSAWLAAAIANPPNTVRYVVDPDHCGLVRVDFIASSAARAE